MAEGEHFKLTKALWSRLEQRSHSDRGSISAIAEWQAIKALPREEYPEIVHVLVEQYGYVREQEMLGGLYHLAEILGPLLRLKFSMEDADIQEMIREHALWDYPRDCTGKYVVSWLEKNLTEPQLQNPAIRDGMTKLAKEFLTYPDAENTRLAARLNSMLADSDTTASERALPLDSVEPWCQKAIADLEGVSPEAKQWWIDLFDHCMTAKGGKPTTKWTKQAEVLVASKARPTLAYELIAGWLPIVEEVPSTGIDGTREVAGWAMSPLGGGDGLKGLAWFCGMSGEPKLFTALAGLAVDSYKKVQGAGPQCMKLGNACIYALGSAAHLEAVGQLAVLKSRLKVNAAQKNIARALEQAAANLRLSHIDLEELCVPTGGLTFTDQRRVR